MIAEKSIKVASKSSQFPVIKALVKHLIIRLLSEHTSNMDLLS